MAETILAVDDDIDILELVEASLTADGFNVITASDGRGALESARDCEPDLILLDLMMPEMDGFEVIEKLRSDAKTRTIPVIMLTAKALSALGKPSYRSEYTIPDSGIDNMRQWTPASSTNLNGFRSGNTSA